MSGPPRSRFFESKRLRLHVADWGNDGAPPMILIHGGLEHARAWDALAQAFRNDFRILALDLRGHGDSEWSKGGAYSVLDSVQDVACLTRSLDLDPAVLVGHSFGGNVAVRYSAIFPERVSRLVCIEGLVPPESHDDAYRDGTRLQKLRRWMDEQEKIARIRQRRYAGVEEAAERLMAAYPRVAKDLARHIAFHGLRAHDDGTFTWKYDDNIRGGAPADITRDELRALWAAIPHPTLLVYGAESWASNPATDGRAAIFRNACVALIPEAGHNVHHDQPERVRQAIGAFIEAADR